MPPSDLTDTSLEHIIIKCQQEACQPREQERGFCFELFRRALEEDDGAAQVALVSQYNRLVQKWIVAYKTNLDGEFDDIVQEVWFKYWSNLFKKTPPRVSGHFENVGQLLKILRLCVQSVTLDRHRKAVRDEKIKLAELSETTEARLHTEHLVQTPEEHLEQTEREERYRVIRERCDALLKEPREQRIFELLYDRGLTPKDVATEYASEFPDIAEVRRMEERIIKRMRRALSG